MKTQEEKTISRVVIGQFGETVLPYPVGGYGGPLRYDPVEPGRRLSNCVGIHDVCRGWVDHKSVSKTHSALHCRSCGMRAVFPCGVKTWGDLLGHFSDIGR